MKNIRIALIAAVAMIATPALATRGNGTLDLPSKQPTSSCRAQAEMQFNGLGGSRDNINTSTFQCRLIPADQSWSYAVASAQPNAMCADRANGIGPSDATRGPRTVNCSFVRVAR